MTEIKREKKKTWLIQSNERKISALLTLFE